MTIVVPTLNRGRFLGDCLRDLLAQSHRPIEILVVDQSPEVPAEVEQLVKDHPEEVSYHRVAFKGLPKARNYGWQHAKYEAILFVDDDIRCRSELAAEHLRTLNLSNIDLVAGGIDEANRPPDPGPPTGRFNPWTAEPLRGFAANGEMDADHVPGGNFSVWRKAIRAVGGFDEALDVGAALYEEADFCLRAKKAGLRIRFNGQARLTHLAATRGGCRVEEVPEYVFGLAHNRGILFRRHLRWYHLPTAVARLLQLALSYTLHYGKPEAIPACVSGLLGGLQTGTRPVICSGFEVSSP